MMRALLMLIMGILLTSMVRDEGATADADYDGNKNSTPDANY